MKRSLALFLQDIRKYVAAERVFTKKEELLPYVADASTSGTYLPDCAVILRSTEETRHVVRAAYRYQIPLYPRGSATSLSGGPLAVRGGCVCDFSHWDDKLSIDPERMTATVSPGVLTIDIDRAARAHGLMYPPDPSSLDIATIGGNVAENAGGPRAVKYGVTGDYVLGLEVVTPTGEVIRTGGQTVKNVTGYDLTSLIVGSEGTLGIITEATLRLIPAPPARKTVRGFFASLSDCTRAVTAIMTSGVHAAKLELMDDRCLRAVQKEDETFSFPEKSRALLLIELDGRQTALEEEGQAVMEVLRRHGAICVSAAASEAEAEKLWQARKLVSPAIMRSSKRKFSEDATVPIDRVPQMMERLDAIGKKYGLNLVVFGHAGDGNLHPNIILDDDRPEMLKKAERAADEIFRAALELEGTLSGEHGIGTMKAAYLPQALSNESIRLMKEIKKAWDPAGIMNPGKIFPDD